MKALKEAGLRIPQDVAVAGYDDIPPAEFASPPLTTLRIDPDTQAREGVPPDAARADERRDLPPPRSPVRHQPDHPRVLRIQPRKALRRRTDRRPFPASGLPRGGKIHRTNDVSCAPSTGARPGRAQKPCIASFVIHRAFDRSPSIQRLAPQRATLMFLLPLRGVNSFCSGSTTMSIHAINIRQRDDEQPQEGTRRELRRPGTRALRRLLDQDLPGSRLLACTPKKPADRSADAASVQRY